MVDPLAPTTLTDCEPPRNCSEVTSIEFSPAGTRSCHSAASGGLPAATDSKSSVSTAFTIPPPVLLVAPPLPVELVTLPPVPPADVMPTSPAVAVAVPTVAPPEPVELGPAVVVPLLAAAVE